MLAMKLNFPFAQESVCCFAIQTKLLGEVVRICNILYVYVM